MKSFLRMLITLLTSACAAAGGMSNVQNTSGLTLQLFKENGNEPKRFVLMLCQHGKCQNPLRNLDGSEFYFYDHSAAYNDVTHSLAKGAKRQTVKIALLGISVIAAGSGVYYLIKDQQLQKQLAKVFYPHGGIKEDVVVKSGYGNEITFAEKGVDASGRKIYAAEDIVMVHEKAERVNRNFRVSAGVAAIAWGATLVPAIAGDPSWKQQGQKFKQLFMQGEQVTVSKEELRALLQIVSKEMSATLAPSVEDFLFTD